MIKQRIRIAVICLTTVMSLPGAAQAPTTSLVDVGGHKLSVAMSGSAKSGAPTVVFASGLGTPLALWSDVQSDLAATTQSIAYDRAGTFGSASSSEAPTLKRIVSDLHALLTKVGSRPPYVLVGHSYGGPIIHTFAALYPSEVAGLVYVDPTDFTQTATDMQVLLEQAGVKGGQAALSKMSEQALVGAPSGIVAEYREFERVQAGGFTEFRSSGEPRDVPTVVLLAGRDEPFPPGMTFPGDLTRYLQALRDQRIAHFSQLTERLTSGTLVLSTGSSHIMQTSEPELISWGIRRVLSTTSARPDLERFTGNYALNPSFVIAISRAGDKLFLQATNQPKFMLVQESSTAFAIKSVGARIEFDVDSAGTVSGLTLVQNGSRQHAGKER